MSNIARKVLWLTPVFALGATACGQVSASGLAADETSRPSVSSPAATADAPVVVELYQSQGCSSCPPANTNVNALAGRRDVLPLSFAVTYWDQLGWTDRFATPQGTARQWDYARRAGRDQVATPQVIINGRRETIVGSNRAQLDAAIRAAGSPAGGPAIDVDRGAVLLKAGRGQGVVWLVRFDPKIRQVSIRAGENGGRTLPHRFIVRELVRLGQWSGPAARFTLPPPREEGLQTAVLVQSGIGGPITAARRV